MKLTTLLAAAGTALAAPVDVDSVTPRAVAAKWCDAASSLCYNEYVSQGQAVYRIAIPTAAAAAPFDIAIQIVAPKAVQWAALSWGGTMTGAPITVAWPNGDNVTVSSRIATGYRLPDMYPDATHTLLPGNGANATHWTLNAVCKGCSKWAARSITPSTSVSLAWGVGNRAPAQPSNPGSSFPVHSLKGKFAFDFVASKADNFETATKPKTAA